MARTRSQTRSYSQTRSKTASPPPPSQRQTRMRSKIAGAAPLLEGLSDEGVPLSEEPEQKPIDQKLETVRRRPRIILHCRPATAAKEASPRSKSTDRVSKSTDKLFKASEWTEYDSFIAAENFLVALYNSTVVAHGGKVGDGAKSNVTRRDVVRTMLPRLQTDF